MGSSITTQGIFTVHVRENIFFFFESHSDVLFLTHDVAVRRETAHITKDFWFPQGYKMICNKGKLLQNLWLFFEIKGIFNFKI